MRLHILAGNPQCVDCRKIVVENRSKYRKIWEYRGK